MNGAGVGATPLDAVLRGIKDRRVRMAVEAIVREPELHAADHAKGVGLSESRLAHLFKQHVGRSIGGFIKAERMGRAARMLRLPGARIKEIAPCACYEHPQNFSRAFVRAFGKTPLRFRIAVDD